MWNFIDQFSTADMEFRKQHTYSLLIATNFDVVFTTESAYALRSSVNNIRIIYIRINTQNVQSVSELQSMRQTKN